MLFVSNIIPIDLSVIYFNNMRIVMYCIYSQTFGTKKKWPYMKSSMTGQEKSDLLIQVTVWAGLTVYCCHICKYNYV